MTVQGNCFGTRKIKQSVVKALCSLFLNSLNKENELQRKIKKNKNLRLYERNKISDI